MIVLEESGLRFEFDNETPFWKWVFYADEDTDFVKVKNLIVGTKSVDFIGIYEGMDKPEAVLMEVKNYADDADLPKPDSSIIDALAQKMRDSLSVIVGANRNSTHKIDEYKEWLKLAIDTEKRLYVIFWIDFPTTWNTKRVKAAKGLFLRTLKQKLKWLTGTVVLLGIDDYFNFLKGLCVSKV